MADAPEHRPPTRRAVVAIGGNALLRAGQNGQTAELVAAADEVALSILPLVRAGWSVLFIHGNGPQVGVELLRNEEASTKVPPFGLDMCVASTQGSMGALLEVSLRNALSGAGLGRDVAVLVSLARVDRVDPAFKRPTKPIGLFYSRYRASQLVADLRHRGWDMIEDSGRGWRPVVPSPKPQSVLSSAAADTLLSAGFLVIAGGGGGVPVRADGRLEGVEAVIDKDRTAALMARELRADLLVFLTAVSAVELNFGTTFAKRLLVMKPEEARRYHAEGHFPPGSMGPKVEASIDFAAAGGTALITSAEALEAALDGRDGTRITIEDCEIGHGTNQLPLPFEL